MSEKTLTKEIAEQFLADPKRYSSRPSLQELEGFTEIADAAAEVLSNHQGDLYLSSITEISDAAVESLSKNQGELCLGIEELSDAAAESLSKTRGDLELYNLEELSDSAAEILSNHEGRLVLGDELIEDFSDSAAEILSNHKGDLTLGLAALSNNAAKSLSKNKYCLNFPNVKAFTCPEKAKILLKHTGGLVFRENIILSKEVIEVFKNYGSTINNVVAKEFVEYARGSIIDVDTMQWFIDCGGESPIYDDEHERDIDLHTEMTDEAADLLASQDFDVVAGCNNSVPLYDIKELSDKAKEVLSKWDGIICDLPAKKWVKSLKNNE